MEPVQLWNLFADGRCLGCFFEHLSQGADQFYQPNSSHDSTDQSFQKCMLLLHQGRHAMLQKLDIVQDHPSHNIRTPVSFLLCAGSSTLSHMLWHIYISQQLQHLNFENNFELNYQLELQVWYLHLLFLILILLHLVLVLFLHPREPMLKLYLSMIGVNRKFSLLKKKLIIKI